MCTYIDKVDGPSLVTYGFCYRILFGFTRFKFLCFANVSEEAMVNPRKCWS